MIKELLLLVCVLIGGILLVTLALVFDTCPACECESIELKTSPDTLREVLEEYTTTTILNFP